MASKSHGKNTLKEEKQVFLAIEELNPYLLCSICFGYLYEATTITECMHTFCKPCIVQHLESNLTCPTCDMKIHPTDPYSALLLDNTMQEIVNKILPSIYQLELKHKIEFYRSFPNTNAPDDTEAITRKLLKIELKENTTEETNQNNVSIYLEHLEFESTFPTQDLAMKFVRVNAKATMSHVEKFLKQKLRLPRSTQILFYTDDVILEPSYTLESIQNNLFEEEHVIMAISYSIHAGDFIGGS